MPALERSCHRCIVGTPRHSNRLCEACKAAGWRWCSMGKHVVTERAMKRNGSRCKACCNEYNKPRLVQKRGTMPPPTHPIPLREFAAQEHYSAGRIAVLAAQGHFGRDAYQRKPRAQWWFREDAII